MTFATMIKYLESHARPCACLVCVKWGWLKVSHSIIPHDHEHHVRSEFCQECRTESYEADRRRKQKEIWIATHWHAACGCADATKHERG